MPEGLPQLNKRKRARVCHISTVHPTKDIRIFEKECCSLEQAGYEVHLITTHQRDEEIRGVKILSLPLPKNRFFRAFKNGLLAYRRALKCRSDLYHFHDPELIPVGFLLSLRKKRVVYDIHEDVPQSIHNKEWIPRYLRSCLSRIVKKLEDGCARRMDYLIAATPAIRNRFSGLASRAVDINNFPMLTEFAGLDSGWERKERAVCYIGSLDRFRGMVEMTMAIGLTDGKLLLAGTISPENQRDLISHLPGWTHVEDLGQLDRRGVTRTLGRSMAGLVLYQPHPNHVHAQPNKMFEYMAAGIPVIASDFPLWREIIAQNKCGICCDPLNPVEIAGAIRWVFDHPEEAWKMGECGRKAVAEKYNWEAERQKLFAVYEQLLGEGA